MNHFYNFLKNERIPSVVFSSISIEDQINWVSISQILVEFDIVRSHFNYYQPSMA